MASFSRARRSLDRHVGDPSSFNPTSSAGTCASASSRRRARDGRVDHANVLQIYASGVHDDVPYFVMEFVEGPTLERWLVESGSPPDLDDAMAISKARAGGSWPSTPPTRFTAT